MKKLVIILACMLVCLCLFSGCTDNKGDDNTGTDSSNAVEIDIDAEGKNDAEVSSDDNDIVYEFIDPENAAGIEVVPRE